MTYEAIIEKQKWVDGSAVEGGSSTMALIDMLSVKMAKDLALDMSLPTKN